MLPPSTLKPYSDHYQSEGNTTTHDIFQDNTEQKDSFYAPAPSLVKMIVIQFLLIRSIQFCQMNPTTKPFGSKLIDSHNSYKAFLTNNNPVFNQKLKKIQQRNFNKVQALNIFQLSNQPTRNLFYFYAQRYSSDVKEDLEEFIIREIDSFLKKNNTSYAIVYVHSSIFDFLAFRRFIEKWPEHFFHRLRKVYILGPSMLVRLVETFSVGTFYRLCDEIFQNTENTEIIKRYDSDLLKSIGQSVEQTEKYKNSVQVIENELYGKMIDEYDLISGRYPKIIIDLLTRLITNPDQLKTEGIFRKSCDHDELERLEKEIIADQPCAIQQQQDIFVVAGCLKKILNNLSHPLFSFSIYNQVINFQGGDENSFIKQILTQMEYVNKKVFILLTIFLNDYIIAQKDYNKMNAYNLAVVFGPCFFRPKEYDLKDLIYSGKFAKILVTIFQNPSEMLDQSEIDLARGTLKGLVESK